MSVLAGGQPPQHGEERYALAGGGVAFSGVRMALSRVRMLRDYLKQDLSHEDRGAAGRLLEKAEKELSEWRAMRKAGQP